jgi:site-specific DNA-methyltransferase (cytosine-N4-specific)
MSTDLFAPATGSLPTVEITPRAGSGVLGVGGVSVLIGDSRKLLSTLPTESVNCCVTSPPYWGLRDYGHADQIGQEATPDEFAQTMVEVFREVRRVLKPDGTLWLNLGDSYYNYRTGYNGSLNAQSFHDGARGKPTNGCARRATKQENLKEKDLAGIPWTVALALRADGWYLRSDIIWSKPNPTPESVIDRVTKAHEYVFMLSKSQNYHFDVEAIKQNGSRRRSVWEVPVQPFEDAHFATFPPELIRPCILAGCPSGGVVLDPFGGSGTTGMVALELGRQAILIELNPDYAKLIDQRTHTTRGFGF